MFHIFMIMLSCLLSLRADDVKVEADTWRPLAFLEGTWRSETEEGTVAQQYEFLFDRTFLQMKTRAEFKPTDRTPQGEIHEDLGVFSYDKAAKAFILRSFHSEGFVNRYRLETSGPDTTLTFASEAVENAPPGTRAKLVFEILGPDSMEQSFHVAWPDREFACFSRHRLERVRTPVFPE